MKRKTARRSPVEEQISWHSGRVRVGVVYDLHCALQQSTFHVVLLGVAVYVQCIYLPLYNRMRLCRNSMSVTSLTA